MTRETTEEVINKRWKQALDHLDQALLLATTEREQFMESLGQKDAELQRTVSQLLAVHSSNDAGHFMESPPWSYQPIESNPQSLIGKRLGAYKLTQYLAKGGMGIVYLAERADKAFRRRVAVKIINADTGLNLYNRFRREVQILADLNHPNLVLLYDAGRMGDGRPFLVMELVEGETLRDWLIQRGPMTPAQTVEVIKQAAAGLHAAHEKGVIHRDIKPANIAVAESGDKLTVKVLDFGVAARKHHDSSGVSSTKGAIGTLLYMSPEQLQSAKGPDLTPASDVYALGLTAYELLTGRPANDGQSQAEIITKHLYENPPKPSNACSEQVKIKIPAAIDSVVMKALAKNSTERYQSVLDFAANMESALHRKPPTTQPVETPERMTEELPVSALPKSAPQQVSVESKTRKYAKPLTAIAAAGVVIVSSLVYWQSDKSEPLATAPPTTPSPFSTPVPTVKLLKLLLTIDNTSGQPLADANLALFAPGTEKIPETVTLENARILRTDKSGKAESNWVIEEGTYLWKAARAGYRSLTGEFTIHEDPNRPGTASVLVTLEPE
jgi:serine/threonine protein kinase